MMLQLKPDFLFKQDIDGTKFLESSHKHVSLKNFPSFVDKVINDLQSGLDEDSLIDGIADTDMSHCFYLLELLKKHGLLNYTTKYIELIPFNAQLIVEKKFSPEKHQLSRFALCRLDGHSIVVETPLSPVQVIIREKEGMELFYMLKEALTFSELQNLLPEFSVVELQNTFSLLVSAKILTPAHESPASTQWDFHDLFFHAKSRLGRQNAPSGGTYRFKGIFPSLPAVKQYTNHKKITLPIPPLQNNISFDEVMQQRKSIRDQGTTPITLQQLGEFLYRSARVKEMRIFDEQELTSRPYPGGGARYELELYPVIHSCEGIPAGMYHYDALEHTLSEVSPFNQDTADLLKNATQASGKTENPQVLLVISARFQRVSWKYQSIAYATILKNVGVLYQTMYLTATAMKLAPCAIGMGDSDLFCKIVGSEYLEETSVGEFILGREKT